MSTTASVIHTATSRATRETKTYRSIDEALDALQLARAKFVQLSLNYIPVILTESEGDTSGHPPRFSLFSLNTFDGDLSGYRIVDNHTLGGDLIYVTYNTAGALIIDPAPKIKKK